VQQFSIWTKVKIPQKSI